MNILVMLFFPLVAHGYGHCPPHMTNATEIQMVAANRHGVNGHDLVETSVFGRDTAKQGATGEAVVRAESDDLLFYFSSHAQAVGDAEGPTMTPWLELRPIGYVEQRVLGGSGDPAPVGDADSCSRSAASGPASGRTTLSGDV